MSKLYKRGETYWADFYRDGQRIRRSLHTDDIEVAQQRLSELSPPERPAVYKDISTRRLWALYELWAQQHQRPQSIRRTRIFWEQVLRSTGAELLGDITLRDVERWKEDQRLEGNSQATINAGIRSMKAVWNRAIRQGWYAGDNPWLHTTKYREAFESPEFLTEHEVELLIEVSEPDIRRAVLLGVFAGFRRGEICNARWEWFKWTRQPRLQLRSTAGFELKDHDERTLPMHSRIRAEFEPDKQKGGWVFEGNGAQYHASLRKRLENAYRAAGMQDHAAFQRLRHTFGSLLAQKGVSLFKIAKWMGHSSVTVTERHYASLQDYDAEIDMI